ncbi:auxin-responsive protein IAA27 isoform X2 [Brachypodium distachyon]|uniref:Auxin-responsive protein n=1 Tax=Brachypodium distachyon TaxID=15368 RepID=A0A0Q3ERJ6_BRADI|nr:auxin-responsive protein IAA27 isoform X2 [Brachypodium distachyon]KQJ88916.1 hypothetical protein BRADI_4g22060v3 [Brachypodium distachyon]|eukprot:XP_024318529.1 auxin-responsive protein IAA27 isoform X2 [Brachypodium distachyon]
MMNLISFETPPLGRRQESTVKAKELVSSSSPGTTCFHGSHDLDLSLGISLSSGDRGGGESRNGCATTGCHGATMPSYSGGGRGGSGDVGKGNGMITSAALSVGRHGGSCHGIVSSSSSWTAASFMPSPTGYMHPWSLAARQQKAAAEQDRSLASAPALAATYVICDARVVSMPAATVGWPPVHTSRRHLIAGIQATTPRLDADMKLDGLTPDAKMDGAAVTGDKEEKLDAAVPRSCRTVAAELRRRPAANMFAKVHMEGCLVGRKINLRAHRSYDSLSRALTKMTRNFFCHYPTSNSGEEDCANSDDFIFLYEDFEGDRMLVGDVPWELFLASAKKLYIAPNPASGDTKGEEEAAKIDAP